MAVVAADTSALMTPVEHDVRLFDEIERLVGSVEVVVPRAVLRELDGLAGTGAGAAARAARVGADLARDRCRILDLEVEAGAGRDGSAADDSLVALARARRVDYVATNDRPLADRVLAAGVPVIGLRGRNKLGITRP